MVILKGDKTLSMKAIMATVVILFNIAGKYNKIVVEKNMYTVFEKYLLALQKYHHSHH